MSAASYCQKVSLEDGVPSHLQCCGTKTLQQAEADADTSKTERELLQKLFCRINLGSKKSLRQFNRYVDIMHSGRFCNVKPVRLALKRGTAHQTAVIHLYCGHVLSQRKPLIMLSISVCFSIQESISLLYVRLYFWHWFICIQHNHPPVILSLFTHPHVVSSSYAAETKK